MLDGIGAVLCLSFVATCLGTTPGLPRPPPPTTAAYLLAFSLVSLLATLGLLPADLLPLQPHGAHRSWQYASAFLCADGAAAAALQLWLFAVHSSALEATHFAAAPLAYARLLAAGAALLAAGGAAAAGGEPLSLAHALCFYVVGLAARVEPTKLTRVLGVTLQWAFVPWLLLLCLLPLTGVRAAIFNTLGLAAALAVHTAAGLPPPRPKAIDAEAEAATPKRKAFGAWQGKPSKPPLKSSPLLGERWLHTAQAGLAVLLLLWQSGTRASDRRAHASVEMAYCRALRQAMDPQAPMLAQLLDKFAKTHPDHPTADAHTIFAAWSFAAEHWAQAQAQAKSGIDLNKLPPADAEVLRGLVAQGLARSELPDEMSDKELVPEALNLMGFSRLVVKPEVLPFLEQAVGEYRRHRARTSAAWSFLKSFLSHTPSPLPHKEVHLAVNASLAEYDLPSRMSDEAVLAELFALLDWPRAALSYCADQLLLAAVRAHRAERAAAARDALRSLSHAARALALDEGAAPPPSAAAAAARNESLHRALLDAFNWMELRADASAEEAWAAAAAALNLSAADEPRLLAVGGAPLLRTVVEQIRARRAAEARVQQAFEELVATVRTEDPALAAEEAKKQRMAEAYEAKRIEWLSALLGRAQQRGLAIPPPRNASDGAAAEAATAAEGEASEVEACDEAPTAARVEEWVEELAALRGKRAAAAETKEEGHERQKHAHYARLLKLPRLIDETLASWIDPSDDLSDKQIFLELLRVMGLPEAIESRLMRAMIEAVKQHRLRREREAVAAGEWRDVPAEPLALRPALHSPRPRLPSAASLVNAAGDGNDFALFVGGVLRGVGARVRLSSGCAANGTAARVCQLFAEVRMGRQPARIVAWARSWLAGSKWVGKTYHYRLDRDGYAWLNLDYIDSRRIQRPGAPYKAFDAQTIYHDELLAWEVEGEEYDSNGQPRLRESPVHSLEMGLR